MAEPIDRPARGRGGGHPTTANRVSTPRARRIGICPPIIARPHGLALRGLPRLEGEAERHTEGARIARLRH
jgi:hypothetical protein